MRKSFPRIVFLDAGTVDHGDISFDVFRKLGPFKAYHHTSPAQLEARMADSEIVLVNKYPLTASLLSRVPQLKLIGLAATGTNNVDLEAARRAKIAVTNVAHYSTESIVQGTFAFLLALAGNLTRFNQTVRSEWPRSPFFTLPAYPVTEIHGKTLGIVGLGNIGRRVAQVARVFGVKVFAAKIPGRDYPSKSPVPRMALGALLKKADFVSLHAPLSPLTERLINAKTLKQMKKGAFLINMARGGLVDEKALARALRSGHLAGAASDVLSVEPPPPDHPLFSAPNFLLTPHAVWGSREARSRLIQEMALNIEAFLGGKRRNRVV